MNLQKETGVLAKFSSLTQRIISAAVLLLILMAAFYFGNPYVKFIWGIICVLMAYEWDRIFYKKFTLTGIINAGLFFSYVLSVLIIKKPETVFTLSEYWMPSLSIFWILGIWCLNLIIGILLKREKAVLYSFGTIYIGLSACLLPLLYDSWMFGFYTVLYVILINAATDTGGFFVGRKFKGPKLAPKISPNKTWSGVAGSLISSVIVAGLYLYILESFEIVSLSEMSVLNFVLYLLFSLSVSVFAILGDLFESWIKRKNGVKDASNLIPGHGGFLDRLDALLFTAPYFYIMTEFF